MDLPPEMKDMRAGKLSPKLYSEISEFLSSVEPDFAISRRTSISTLVALLSKFRERAKTAKNAERIIRAICAAIGGERRISFRGSAHGAQCSRREKKFRRAEGQLELPYSRATMEKFADLGITDPKSIAMVIRLVGGEEEFGKRYDAVVKAMPRDAYRLFFSVPANANFLCSSNFYHAVQVLGEKVKLIDALRLTGRMPEKLEYKRNPNALHMNLSEINGIMRIVRRVHQNALAMLSSPEGLRDFMEKVGFRTAPSTNGGYACVRAVVGGGLQIARIEPIKYDLPALNSFMARAGVSGKDMRRGGVVE